MKILFVYPRFERHADSNPELRQFVPMNEYLGSPSLGIAMMSALVDRGVFEVEYRDDRLSPADIPTDADIVAFSFFTPAAERAMELAAYFKAQGAHTVSGGIFTSMMPHVVAEHFDTIVVGEAEDSWVRFLDDFRRGEPKPRYDCLGPVDLSTAPLPDLSLYFGAENDTFQPDDYPLQISRGCPMRCHACVLPGVMGKKLRAFPTEHVIGQLDQLTAVGKRASLTEDTSWFPAGMGRRRLRQLVDHVIETEQFMSISYIGISMPMILSTPTSFLERARSAGVTMYYLVGGFDPVTMNAFTGKDPKNLQRAYDAIAKAHDVGIEPYTSFLIGQDFDDEGTVDRMLEFANKAQIRKAEFAIFTPYPGTRSWHQLESEGRILHRSWTKYNDANVVFQPKNFTPEGLQQAYIRLWREYYATRQHLADLPQADRTIQF